MLNNKHYIVVVDYYSRYIELSELRNETADDVIRVLKSIFARHGVPMTCVSDNGPCYSSAQFAEFARSYGFSHQTSSPRYAQANGASERAVQTAKSLIKKAADPFLALLSYRSTPLENGYSPAQLLMGRQLRSTVPISTASLRPQTPDATTLQQLDRNIKQRQANNYNRRHHACEQKRRQIGDYVWIPDLQTNATVTNVLPYRSYQLRTDGNNIIRRNGRSLRNSLPSTVDHNSASSSQNLRCRIRDSPQHQFQPSAEYVTRSGRHVRPPTRFET
jgi:hypothetical protein